MSYSITQSDILSVPADAAVLAVEITGSAADGPACRRLWEEGGTALEKALREMKFLPIGSACAGEPGVLPFRHLILTATPRWLTGKSNELLALRCCYESVFALAEQLDCRRLVLPFLSAQYYRFPREEAIRVALTQAGEWEGEAVFVADTPELYAMSQRPYRKPEIVSYIGYYRDHAIFALDNGLFARVDLRPEITAVSVIPYFEACYRMGNNPLQPPLPETEILRLRRIYEENDWY